MKKISVLLVLLSILAPFAVVCSAEMPQKAEGKRIPVLMYHAVSDVIWGERGLFVSPASLDAQIEYLLSEGYTPITFEDVPSLDYIEKPIMLTFDDGYRDNYLNVFPILKKYGVKATFFVITDTFDHNLYLNREMIRALSDSGLVSIQSHTVHHAYLSRLDMKTLEAELRDSARAIAEVTGKEPIAICYPFGAYNNTVMDIASQYYDWGLCIEGKCWHYGDEPMSVKRLQINRSTTLDEYKRMLK